MNTPSPSLDRRDTWARSATSWVLCSLAGMPVVFGVLATLLTR